MILTNELRIGNWVLSDRPIQIKSLTYQLPELLYIPIRLTPEILERCGFEPFNADYRKGNFKIYSGHHEFFFWYNDFEENETGEVKLNYLHQLQNLYFTLTGNELEINL